MSKVAFLFPGQGAQSVGMGRTAHDSSPKVRELFDRARHVLGYDLARLCFDGPADQLNSTVYSQPALFVVSFAALEMMKEQSPDVVATCGAAAGLSLGEYTALAFAGAMDFETGVRLVQRRGEAMQSAADAVAGGMVSVLGLEWKQVDDLCSAARGPGEVLQVANLLCPGNIVISGSQGACERVIDLGVQAGAMKMVPLAVAGAFHTPLMQPAADALRVALADAKLKRPTMPVISNVDFQSHDDPDDIRQNLLKQLVSPVRWEQSIATMMEQGIDSFWEVGPGRVLRGLLKRIDRKIACETAAA